MITEVETPARVEQETGPHRVFLSFRRGDSTAVAGQIFDRMANYYRRGTVLNDIGRVPAAIPARKHVRAILDGVAVLLVVIGPSWLDMANRAGVRRLEDADDPVRLLIEEALARAIPVRVALVRGAAMPTEERLPESMKALAAIEPVRFSTPATFNADIRRLYTALNQDIAAQRNPATRTALDPSEPSEHRKGILRSAREHNVLLQQPPYSGVAVHSLGELLWVLREDGQHQPAPLAGLKGPDLRGISLAGVNLTHVDLTGADLAGADLAHANMKGANLTRANLTEARLDAANLQAATLQAAKLDGAKLNSTSLVNANLSLASLADAELDGTDLTGAHLVKAVLNALDLHGAKLDNADLTGCALRSASLYELDLTSVILREADLTGADLHGAKLQESRLDGAILNEASLEHADLQSAHLSKASCVGTNLARANLQDADATSANLGRALLDGAHLDGADLRGADLTNARLATAHLLNAKLNGATLNGAKMQGAHAGGAALGGAKLHGADLTNCDLRKADLTQAELEEVVLTGAQLDGTDFSGCGLDGARINGVEDLRDCILDLGTRLDRVWWGGLAPRDGKRGKRAKEPAGSKRAERIRALNHEAIVRHQLAEKMSSLGLLSKASDYRMEEQTTRRKELFWRRRFGGWLFSWLLFIVAGYGEKPARTLLWYVALVSGFAAMYYGLTHYVYTQFTRLSLPEALVVSLGSFHGRGFFPSTVTLGGPMAAIGTVEAVVGLFIELIFIATFTRRFLGN